MYFEVCNLWNVPGVEKVERRWLQSDSSSSDSRSCFSRFHCDSSTTAVATRLRWWRYQRQRYRPTTVRAASPTPLPPTVRPESHRRRRHYCFRSAEKAGRRRVRYAVGHCRRRTAAAGAPPVSGSRSTHDFLQSAKPEVTWRTCRRRRRGLVG